VGLAAGTQCSNRGMQTHIQAQSLRSNTCVYTHAHRPGVRQLQTSVSTAALPLTNSQTTTVHLLKWTSHSRVSSYTSNARWGQLLLVGRNRASSVHRADTNAAFHGWGMREWGLAGMLNASRTPPTHTAGCTIHVATHQHALIPKQRMQHDTKAAACLSPPPKHLSCRWFQSGGAVLWQRCGQQDQLEAQKPSSRGG
jgi:hypothetical protein